MINLWRWSLPSCKHLITRFEQGVDCNEYTVKSWFAVFSECDLPGILQILVHRHSP